MDAARNSAAKATSDHEIVIARVIDAPRELVWKAWTDPAQVVKWWGPNGFTTTIEKMDVRPGGAYRIVMPSVDGTEYLLTGVYREMVATERLVMTIDCSEHPDN